MGEYRSGIAEPNSNWLFFDDDAVNSVPTVPTSALTVPAESENVVVPADVPTVPADSVELLGRGHRTKFPSTRLDGFVTSDVSGCSRRSYLAAVLAADTTTTHLPSTSLYPIDHYLDYGMGSSLRVMGLFLLLFQLIRAQHSFPEAVQDDRWCVAMRDEINALERNGTWKLESLPVGKKAIGCKWVFQIKHKADGSIERLLLLVLVLRIL